MEYVAPRIDSGPGVSRMLKDLPGPSLVVTMELPWRIFTQQVAWAPNQVYMVPDMDQSTVEAAHATLPECDVVVGLGGGSCCDMAKYLAWKRQCRMILVPTIVSVDAPLTDAIAVRVDKTVKYVGQIFPEELLIDYDLIQKAPKDLNRAGACDIASIHTALWDWRQAHEKNGEAYDADVAHLAKECLADLDRNAAEIHAVTPKGIDAIIDLYRREVAFCTRIGTSRPEEGAEHIVAYGLEHLTRRHFLHGDLVGLGIFIISRLQQNEPDWALDLLKRLGLRYTCPDATEDEIRQCLATLKSFKEEAKLFHSVVDTRDITPDFIDEALAKLYE